MTSKTCIISGANSGIGKAAATQIAQQGYRVIMACRDRERSQEALHDIRHVSGSEAVDLMIVDMSLQASIRKFCGEFQEKYDALDVLIHNAAAFDTRQKEIAFTSEGIEKIWATNHIGPVLMTDVLLPAIKKAEQGRVITISSKGLVVYPRLEVNLEDPEFRQRKFSVQKAYYQSKLAQVMYTYWLADQLKGTPITANSIRVTNVRIDVDKRYPDMPALMRKLYSIKSRFAITPAEMAETYTYLATSPEVSQITGRYYDDFEHIVESNAYSRQPENIRAVMDLTQNYIQAPSGEPKA